MRGGSDRQGLSGAVDLPAGLIRMSVKRYRDSDLRRRLRAMEIILN